MNLTELVQQHLPNKKKKSATGVYICCPMCITMGEARNDTKFRCGFTVQPDQGFLVHCYNCHFSTQWKMNGRVSKNLMKFLTKIGISSKQVPIKLRLLRHDEKAKSVIIDDDIPDVAIEFDEVDLPIDCRSFEDWAEDEDPHWQFYDAFEYLASRGEPVFEGWKYFWTPYAQFSWNQRVIIPFYHHGKIVGYTGRTFTNNPKLSKYYSKQPEDFMFNQDKIESDTEILILTEGVLDAISIKGIGILGNSLTKKQINLLNTFKKRIILIPDRNEAGRRLLDQVLDQGWEVSIPELWMDDKNIRDSASSTKRYGRIVTLEQIIKNATENKMKITLRFNMWSK